MRVWFEIMVSSFFDAARSERFAMGLVAAGFLVAGMTGCGSSPSSPTPIPPYQGNWAGTTSQGLPISFVVTGSAVTSISISYRAFPGAPCTGDPDTGDAEVTPVSLPISDSGAGVGPGVPGFQGGPLTTTEFATAYISGSFSSGAAASGDMGIVEGPQTGLIGGFCFPLEA